jgi:outer membrane protein OmpA-like peptidoglycan-associated protein
MTRLAICFVFLVLGCAGKEQPTVKISKAPEADFSDGTDFKSFKHFHETHKPRLAALEEDLAELNSDRDAIIKKASGQLDIDIQKLEQSPRQIKILQDEEALAKVECESLSKKLKKTKEKSQAIAGVMECQEKIRNKAREISSAEAELRELQVSVLAQKELEPEAFFEYHVRDKLAEITQGRLDYYKYGIEVMRALYAEGSEARIVEGEFIESFLQEKELLNGAISVAAVLESEKRNKVNVSMADAVFQVFVLNVHFNSGEFNVLSLVKDERRQLEEMVEALRKLWSNTDIQVYLDGHADKQAYEGGACVSDGKNLALSKSRAGEIKTYLVAQLESGESRIHVDGFGNFSPLHGQDDARNRRIELRIVALSESAEKEHRSSHQEYFDMLAGLDLGEGLVFARQKSRWIQEACLGKSVTATPVKHLSGAYNRLMRTLGPKEGVQVDLEEGHSLDVSLGNNFVVRSGEDCFRIVPCD